MKIVEEKEKKIIVLDEGDVIEVKTLKGNPLLLRVECQEGCLLVDEINIKRIKEIGIEEVELAKLKQYNQRNK